MRGILGTRGDLLSDILIIALLVILPSLAVGVAAAIRKNYLLHRKIMLIIFTALVLYVVVYEANLTLLGGINYLQSKIRMPSFPYFAFLAFHISLSAAALILGGITISRGEAALQTGRISGESIVSPHRKIVWWEVTLLLLGVLTGMAIYYMTFILRIRAYSE